MMTTTSQSVDSSTSLPAKLPTLRWALKRALLAVVILVLFIGTTAWLLHASIEPEPNASEAGLTLQSANSRGN